MFEFLKTINKRLEKENVLFTDEKDIFFLTRFVSWNINVLKVGENWYLLTDKRYIEDSTRRVTWMKCIDYTSKDWINIIKEENPSFDTVHINDQLLLPKMFEAKKSLFESININVEKYDYGFIRDLYSSEDVEIMKKATEINELIFNKVFNSIKVGMTEKEIEHMILKEMAEYNVVPAFETNVCSGERTSSPVIFPASDRTIKENEFLTIDMGIIYNGFYSDMTRTFIVEGDVSEEEREIWETAYKANMEAIGMVKEGAIPSEIYAHVISVMNEDGKDLAKYFPHGVGHCLGVELHNQPGIGPGNNVPLKAGQVLNIEPGIYIPGKYGVRIEQTILVTKDGHEFISKVPVNIKK